MCAMSHEARIRDDLSYLAQCADRCLTAAEECETSLAAIGLRELAKEYLALAAKIRDAQVAQPGAAQAGSQPMAHSQAKLVSA